MTSGSVGGLSPQGQRYNPGALLHIVLRTSIFSFFVHFYKSSFLFLDLHFLKVHRAFLPSISRNSSVTRAAD